MTHRILKMLKLEALLKGLEQKEKDIKSQIDASIAEDLQERE